MSFLCLFFLILLGTQNGKHVNYLKTIRDILNNLLCVICDHDSQNRVLYHLPYNVYDYVKDRIAVAILRFYIPPLAKELCIAILENA